MRDRDLEHPAITRTLRNGYPDLDVLIEEDERREEEERLRHNEANRRYYKTHPEQVRATVRAWQKAHPEKCREYRRRYREKEAYLHG